MTKSCLVLDFNVISWEDGASFVDHKAKQSKVKPKQFQMTFDTQSQNCSKTDNPWNYITEVNILNPTLSQHWYYGNNTDNICHIHAKTYFNMKKKYFIHLIPLWLNLMDTISNFIENKFCNKLMLNHSFN